MDSQEMMQQRIDGLKQSIRDLRQKERTLQKAQTLEEQAESNRQHLQELEQKVEAQKKEIASLQEKKRKAVEKSARDLAEAMKQILPYGEAVFEITDDGKAFLGWKKNGQTVPRSGLSGGETAIFDAALSYALLGGHGVLVIEAAELDRTRFDELVQRITTASPDVQIIANTCHLDSAPEGWNVVNLEEASS